MSATELESDQNSKVSPAVCIQLVVLAGLILWLFHSSLRAMSLIWLIDPNYTHGFLVPLFSAIFAWRIWQQNGQFQAPAASSTVIGGCLIVVGAAVHCVAWMMTHWFLDVVSLITVLFGAIWILGGYQAANAFRFPILFLLFMAPLPASWYQPFAIFMQLTTAKVSCFFLESFGIPSYLEGYLIHLPGYSMEVGAACSGLRQLIAILALAVGIGHWIKRGWRFSIVLTLSSMLIAILANALRVVLTGLIMVLLGKAWAEGVFHTMEGVLVQAVAMGSTLLFAAFLCRIEDRWLKKGEVSGVDSSLESSVAH